MWHTALVKCLPCAAVLLGLLAATACVSPDTAQRVREVVRALEQAPVELPPVPLANGPSGSSSNSPEATPTPAPK